MNEHSWNPLPVVEDDRVVGMITRNDIFRLVARLLELTEQLPESDPCPPRGQLTEGF